VIVILNKSIKKEEADKKTKAQDKAKKKRKYVRNFDVAETTVSLCQHDASYKSRRK
jgi:hypothetical protein